MTGNDSPVIQRQRRSSLERLTETNSAGIDSADAMNTPLPITPPAPEDSVTAANGEVPGAQESATTAATTNSTNGQPYYSSLYIWKLIPYCCKYDKGPPEATGLAIDFYARAVVLMSSIFMGPALLQLATEAAGCPNEQDCETRIIGGLMKPSSVLSNIAILTGLTVSLLMPLFGAMVDYTPYRRAVGAYTAYTLSVVKMIEACVSIHTWFYVSLLQIISGVLYFCHTTAGYAYNSELSKDTVEQTKYNTYYFFILYLSTLVFLAQILVLSTVFNTDDVGTARISQIVTSLTSGACFLTAWSCFFREKPPSRALPTGSCLFTAGFRKTLRTFASIRITLPSLWWLMCSIMMNESATATLITIATTYMAHFLDMDTSEIGVVFFVVLVMGVPGSQVGHWMGLKLNPLRSAQVCVLYFTVVTCLAALVLYTPERKQWTALFGAFWGIGLGWLHPMNSTMFMTMIPLHSRTEYMGVYIFCGQVLSWMPPLVFTVLNEAGVPMSIGLASLNIFFLIGFSCLVCIGNYHKAVEQGRQQHGEGAVVIDESESPGLALPSVT